MILGNLLLYVYGKLTAYAKTIVGIKLILQPWCSVFLHFRFGI